MALIQCSECNKDVSDKAAACPSCGNPIKVADVASPVITPSVQEEYLCCPKCGSKELHSERKGFSGAKALGGAIVTGGIGLLAGTLGSNKVYLTCLKCGKKIKAGEARVVRPKSLQQYTPTGISLPESSSQNAMNYCENRVRKLVSSGKNIEAVKFYKEFNQIEDIEDASAEVNRIAECEGQDTGSNARGCLNLVIICVGAILIVAVFVAYIIKVWES